jgi:hypothetical protein
MLPARPRNCDKQKWMPALSGALALEKALMHRSKAAGRGVTILLLSEYEC